MRYLSLALVLALTLLLGPAWAFDTSITPGTGGIGFSSDPPPTSGPTHAVPLPSTLVLLALGGAALALRRRR